MTIADLLSKIFRDLFFLSLLTFAAFLLAEGLLPGILTRYVSFTTLTIAVVFITLCAALFPVKDFSSRASSTPHILLRSPLLIILLIFSALVIANALLGFPVSAMVIIFCAISLLFFLLFSSF